MLYENVLGNKNKSLVTSSCSSTLSPNKAEKGRRKWLSRFLLRLQLHEISSICIFECINYSPSVITAGVRPPARPFANNRSEKRAPRRNNLLFSRVNCTFNGKSATQSEIGWAQKFEYSISVTRAEPPGTRSKRFFPPNPTLHMVLRRRLIHRQSD